MTVTNVPNTCFFCGKPIVAETDIHEFLAYKTCPECHAAMQEGIPVVSVTGEPNFKDQPPICGLENADGKVEPAYPTGEYGVFSENALSALFGPEQAGSAKAKGFLLVRPDVFSGLKEIYDKTMMPEVLKTQNPEDSGMPIPEES